MSDKSPPPDVDDIKFTAQLLDRIAERLCIDEDRIYVTGLGTGGGMVQLIACDEGLSTRIAAYGMVNANVFRGFQAVAAKTEAEAALRDKENAIWRKCNPKRLPVRLLTIGTENNTVFDYWGKTEIDGRPREDGVKVIVDWATRNECGHALEMPKNWRSPDDRLYKTMLEKGYIFEGFIEHGSVTKATYHCWGSNRYDVPVAKKKKNKRVPPNSSEQKKDTKPEVDTKDDVKSLKDRKEVDSDINEFVEKLRDSFILEHYLIRGLDHGWPRVEAISAFVSEGSSESDATKDDVKTVQLSRFNWRHISGPMRSEIDLGFNLEGAYSFHYGFSDPEPKNRKPHFDTTARLIDFFRMYRLSDDLPTSPRNDEGMTEAEENEFSGLIKALMDVDEAERKNAKAAKNTLEELTGSDEQPVKKIEKDEL
jgi:poly(3-hydroxybutyrate) depolymerase